MSVPLTRDSDALICVLYKSYLDKRKQGVTKDRAKLFGDHTDIRTEHMPKWPPEDVIETIRELGRANLLETMYGSGEPRYVALADAGIIYMENRFPLGLDSVINHMAKIKTAIPFV